MAVIFKEYFAMGISVRWKKLFTHSNHRWKMHRKFDRDSLKFTIEFVGLGFVIRWLGSYLQYMRYWSGFISFTMGSQEQD
jgi:hypothetical protein